MKKHTALLVIIVAIIGCTSASNKTTIDDFIRIAQSQGWEFEHAEGEPGDNPRHTYIVAPGEMYITLEQHPDAGSAREVADDNNVDLEAIKRHVIREGVPLGEMGRHPQAFAHHNLVMYIPLDYIVYYPEGETLAAAFLAF